MINIGTEKCIELKICQLINLPVIETFVAICVLFSTGGEGSCGGGPEGDGKLGVFGEDLEDTKSE